MRIKVLISGLLSAAVLLGAASIDSVPWALGAAVVLLQLIFAYAWPRLVQAQAPWPLTLILVLCGLASSAAAVFMPGVSHMSHGVEVIAVGVLLTFISQVLRGADAEGRMTGVVSGITGVIMTVLGSAWAAAGTMPFGLSMTVVTVLGMLGAGTVAMSRLPNRITMLLGPVIAAALGAAATALPLNFEWYTGLVLGLLAGLLVSALRGLALASRSVQNLTGVFGFASGLVLVAGSASWYALELIHVG